MHREVKFILGKHWETDPLTDVRSPPDGITCYLYSDEVVKLSRELDVLDDYLKVLLAPLSVKHGFQYS